MLLVHSIKDSPRLRYIAKILFETILGIDYEIEIVLDGFEIRDAKGPIITYGILLDGAISISSESLLFEDNIRNQDVNIETDELPKLRFSEWKPEGYSIDFDLFSSAFYLITQYEQYHSTPFDAHGRYDERYSTLHKNGIENKPVVEIYALYLWAQLKAKYPDIQRKTRKFDYKITFDIDSPYLYQHKGFILSLASLIKNIARLKLQSVFQQTRAIAGGKDPYDVYDYIIDKVQTDKLLFFFLIDRKSPHDGRHTFKNKAYRNLIKKISDTGIETGIHPSYSSFMDADLIRTESIELGAILGNPITSSRMHFLKYRLPETYDYLRRAGIQHDYTLCPIHNTGFKTFIARPYPWFDLKSNQETNLMLYPTMVMDRSLQQYMHLTPEDALVEIKKVIDATFAYNGVFTMLFHNNSLSETSEWKGWKMVFDNTMLYLSTKKKAN